MKKYLIKISWSNGTNLTQSFKANTQQQAFRNATAFIKDKRLGKVDLKLDAGVISITKTVYLY